MGSGVANLAFSAMGRGTLQFNLSLTGFTPLRVAIYRPGGMRIMPVSNPLKPALFSLFSLLCGADVGF